ncbi:MAG: Gfo/Idh/MocA family protein [Opitutales bacterium]
MSYPLKIGVVGCGNIAEKAYLPFAQNRSEFKVAACTDVRAEMAQRLAANFDIPRVHASFDDMLADPEIDVVLNLTHPAAHAEVNLRAIEAGKHAYCEKPFALTREDGQAVLDKAREAGLRVGCAPDTVLGPGTQTARAAIAAGMIGEPATARVTWGNPGMESWHPNPEFYYKRGGGPMLDMGPYFVSSIVQMLGPIKSVTGRAKASRPDRLITSEPLKGAIIDVETPTHISGVIETQSGVHVLTLMSYDLFGEVGFNKLP